MQHLHIHTYARIHTRTYTHAQVLKKAKTFEQRKVHRRVAQAKEADALKPAGRK